jgi:tartrate dehydratase beta subunit/fumarate hydratase class I family protein
MADESQDSPVPLTGAALLHTAPNARRLGGGTFEPVPAGTTTWMRMDRFTRACLKHGTLAFRVSCRVAMCGPLVDTITASRIANMKELRPPSAAGLLFQSWGGACAGTKPPPAC